MTLRLNGKTLVEDRDYKLLCFNNEIGLPSYNAVTVRGIGNYTDNSGCTMFTYSFDRRWGQNAIDTSAKIARFELDQGMGCNGICVATGQGYWDALAGGPLAAKYNAVLVLSNPSNYSAIQAACQYNFDKTKGKGIDAYLTRALNGHVLGGPVAVPAATLTWCNHVYDYVR